MFYLILFCILYLGVLALCWHRWTQETKERQQDDEQFAEVEKQYNKIKEG